MKTTKTNGVINQGMATRKALMLDALVKTLGIVTPACKIIGINRSTYYDWYHDDPAFKSQADDISEIAIDFAESKLHKMIGKDNIQAIIFYLRTKGKMRGYIETTEHINTNKKLIMIDADEETEDVTHEIIEGRDDEGDN